MSHPRRILIATLLSVATVFPLAAAAAQSAMSVSPFLSLVPSAGSNPLAGMALTFGGTTGLAFRGSAALAIANANAAGASTVGYRPWGADADAMLFLGGLGGGATVFSHSLSPYLFTGLGLTGGDSAGANVVHNGWSYGAGATIPLGLDADVFGEARWRMPEYILPTAHMAPSATSEFRFGLSFHIGGSGANRGRGPRYGDQAPPAPAPAPVTVIYPPMPPAPVVIVPSGGSAAYPSAAYPPAPYPPADYPPVAYPPVDYPPVAYAAPIIIGPVFGGPVFGRPVIQRAMIVAPGGGRPLVRRPLVGRSMVAGRGIADPRARAPQQLAQRGAPIAGMRAAPPANMRGAPAQRSAPTGSRQATVARGGAARRPD